MSAHWSVTLTTQDACPEAVRFAEGFASFDAAWQACARGDWLLWWIGRTLTAGPMRAERRPLVRAMCGCVRLALPCVPVGEHRPLAAIEVAERWAAGDDGVTRQQLLVAAASAYDAYEAYEAYIKADDAAYAAVAASYAASAVFAESSYSAADASAAYAVTAVVRAFTLCACADLVRAFTRGACADLVRAEFPHPPEMAS